MNKDSKPSGFVIFLMIVIWISSMEAVSSIPLVILPTAMASFFHCYFSLIFSMTIFSIFWNNILQMFRSVFN